MTLVTGLTIEHIDNLILRYRCTWWMGRLSRAGDSGFNCVVCDLWLLLTPSVAVSRLSAAPARAEAERLGWLVQHPTPVWAKPDGRPRLEGHATNTLKLLTSYVSLLHPTRHAYTSTHLPILLLSLGQHTGPLRGLSAEVQSRLDLCPQ